MSDLVVSDLVKRYEDQAVLDGVSLEAAQGDMVAIVGPSGSGKSTLLNILGALDTPTSGAVRVCGIDVPALRGAALARYRAERVGFVFQDHHLLPQLTALENVLLPTLAARRAGAPDRARALLARVGVAHRAGAFPAQMSGGERQRVAIARALVNEPGLLLCDEPTGNLDADTGATVVSLLLDLAADPGAVVLMVTHNADHASRFARRLHLAEGALQPLRAGVEARP